MKKGWIKLHRQIEQNPLYFAERFTKISAWVDLLVLANHDKGIFYIRGNEVRVNPGQVGYAIKTLGNRWKWNERTVLNFLKWLEKEQMIQYRTSHITTIITILNWNFYQGSTEQNTVQTQNRIHTNKNDNNVKNYKEEVKQAWNEFAKQNDLSPILKLTDTRAQSIMARLKEKEFDLPKIYEIIKNNDFLKGKNDRKWKVDFDFIFCSTSGYIKILEGKYGMPKEPQKKIDYSNLPGMERAE